MSSYFFTLLQVTPTENVPLTDDVVTTFFQEVIGDIVLLLFIGGALLLVVLLLRFAARVNALPHETISSSSEPIDQQESLSSSSPISSDAHIEIKAQNYQSVSVEWSVPAEMSDRLQQERSQSLMIRLLDVTQIDLSTQLPHAIYDYPCDWGQDDSVQVMGIAVVQGDRDYIAELGYMTADRRWQQLARSTHVRVAATVSSS